MKNQFFLSVLIIISFSLNIQIATARPQNNFSYQSLKETILALDHTRTKSQKEIKRLRNNPPSVYNKKQVNEFTVFYEYLSYQINEYCKQIGTDYGQNKLQDLPCDNSYANQAMLNSENYSEQKELKTASEQINELEDEFMVSLGNFDEMLLKEEQEISRTSRKKIKDSASQTNKNSKGSISSYQGVEASDKKNTGKNQSSETSQNQEKNKAQQAREKQNRGKGYGMGRAHKNQSANNNKTSDTEKRKLDEINDDIVARQLKEAAEKETDPQLKEKLWQEYYRYKKGLNK